MPPLRPIRPRRRPFAAARQRLARANEHFAHGEYGKAASIFQELAEAAEGRGILDRAGDLRMRVAQCYLKLDNLDRADDEARHALRLYLRAQRPRKVRRLLPKVMATLEKHGRQDEAKELREKAEQLLGSAPVEAGPLGPGIIPARGTLPGKCPYCGSVVNAT
ncbi:MAG: hypothetical protein AMJ93_10855 [Anaerolineae bacterium SM23_84]|nr:MAG: hypothetical protein AMJ93_10855 [Anaerolineae bacterium SM23_84]